MATINDTITIDASIQSSIAECGEVDATEVD